MANLITNPTFDSNTTGWTANGSASITRVTSPTHAGAGACQVTVSASWSGLVYDYSSATAGLTIQGSIWVQVGTYTGTVFAILKAYDSGYGTLDETDPVSIGTPPSWEQLTTDPLVVPVGTAHLQLQVMANNSVSGTYFCDDGFLDYVSTGGMSPGQLNARIAVGAA